MEARNKIKSSDSKMADATQQINTEEGGQQQVAPPSNFFEEIGARKEVDDDTSETSSYHSSDRDDNNDKEMQAVEVPSTLPDAVSQTSNPKTFYFNSVGPYTS